MRGLSGVIALLFMLAVVIIAFIGGGRLLNAQCNANGGSLELVPIAWLCIDEQGRIVRI